MRSLVKQAGLESMIELDSAGTDGWHEGEHPDSRSVETARARGIEVKGRSRPFQSHDFKKFDYVLAMDRSNYNNLLEIAGTSQIDNVFMLRSFDPHTPQGPDVPDPYYGGTRGFDNVFDLCESACSGLLDFLRKQHNLPK